MKFDEVFFTGFVIAISIYTAESQAYIIFIFTRIDPKCILHKYYHAQAMEQRFL